MRLVRWLVPVLLLGCVRAPPPPVPREATRLLVVRTPSWESPAGTLTKWERGTAGWTKVGQPVPVVLGSAGLKWGRGRHWPVVPKGQRDEIKLEGDGASPAGAFDVRTLYGASTRLEGTVAEYRQVNPSWRCIDDPASVHYTKLMSVEGVKEDWLTAEKLIREDGLYEWIGLVEHNVGEPIPALGSCIFLHTWADAQSSTRGCTAMEQTALEETLRFIPADGATLIQLPDAVYESLKEAWGLP